MKKRKTAALACLALVPLAACGNGAASPGSAPAGPSEGVQAAVRQRATEREARALDELLAFVNRWQGDADDKNSAGVWRLEGLEVCLVGVVGGGSELLVREDAGGEVFRCELTGMEVRDVVPDPEGEARVLFLFAELRAHAGDAVFSAGPCRLRLRYDTGEVLAAEPQCDWAGVVGVQRGGDRYAFADCFVEQGGACLRFALVDYAFGDIGAGADACPEIHLRRAAGAGAGGGDLYTLAFEDTRAELPGDFLAALGALEGVRSAQLLPIDEPILAGAQLLIECEPGYRLDYRFNRSGALDRFEDFNLRPLAA